MPPKKKGTKKSKADEEKKKKKPAKKATSKKKTPKKSVKKKAAKPTKAAKKKPTKKVKKNIEKAVDSIPGLIFEHTPWEAAEPKPAPKPKKKSVPHYQEPRHATMLTWLGVGTITLFIIGLWIINARTMITDAVHNPNQEAAILSNAREDFSAIFATLADAEEDESEDEANEELDIPTPEETEATIRETLATLIPQIPITTSTATSTEKTPTSTPIEE